MKANNKFRYLSIAINFIVAIYFISKGFNFFIVATLLGVVALLNFFDGFSRGVKFGHENRININNSRTKKYE